MQHRSFGREILLTLIMFGIAGAVGCRKRAAQASTDNTMVAAEHHACTYLSRDEVEQILGGPVNDGVEEGTRCTFAAGEGGISQAKIEFTWHGGDLAYRQALARKQALSFASVNIPGVGDEAAFGLPSTLYVHKGDVFFTVDVYPSDNPRDKAVAIAEKLLSRI